MTTTLGNRIDAIPSAADLIDRMQWSAIREALASALPDQLRADALAAPLQDFLARPGKLIRGTLAHLSHRLGGGTTPFDVRIAALVELLHAGSLIVDDIEDDALTRRGRPALHRVWGTPRALNAGNWLYFAALRLIDDWAVPSAVKRRAQRRTIRTLLRCHEGQALDLAVRVTALPQTEVLGVVYATTAGKSAALLELASWCGAMAGGAPTHRVRALGRFGRRLGMALQMHDDLLGFFAEAHAPKCDEDLLHARPTWAWAWLAMRLDAARFDALVAAAREVEQCSVAPRRLAAAMRDALGDDARARPGRAVERAMHDLARALGPSADLLTLRAEIARWERHYA
jgi:geranylgeranyl pyrophosphate synthase